MLKSELLEIISHRENSRVEFKCDDVRPERLAREIVALVNHEGGRLLLGVEDDGSVSGVRRDDLELWVMDTVIAHHVHPWILPSLEMVRLDENTAVAVITVSQGTAKPYVLRHQGREEIFIRMGSTSRRATREQQARLFESGGLIHAEILPVSGTSFTDLSRDHLENYFRDVLGESISEYGIEVWIDRTCQLGFMTKPEGGDATCTVAGLLLFGRAPRRSLRQAGIRWMAFSGPDKDYEADDDTIIDAPLLSLWSGVPRSSELIEPGLFERFLERVRPFLSHYESLMDGLQRGRTWDVPVEALRETVVNAIAHRDWTRMAEVEIVRYSDRLEVTSPGALQNAMTVEKMKAGQRSARNSIVVDTLRDYGYVDARGMGVRRKIIPLVRESSGREPEFEETDDYLRVIIALGQPRKA